MKDFAELKVGVLGGGPGSEREVSVASARGVVEALRPLVASVELVEVGGPGFDCPSEIDVAFNVIHGTYGEDGELQAEMEARGINYTGAREASSRLAFDKVKSRERFIEAGVSTPKGLQMLIAEADPTLIGFPCVVKPPREGSSVGVHIVEDEEGWQAAIEDAAKYGEDTLVEECIVGKELTVGVVNDVALPIVHIQPRSGFYDMSNKYPWLADKGGTDYFCPAELSAETTEQIQALALAAHRALGIEVYSRVDVLLNAEEQPFVLEVNTIPGMTESSLLPKAAKAAGMEFSKLCLNIIESSLSYGFTE
jgi:D-alanine-D-alanine ligase